MSGELTDYQQENSQKPDREKTRFEFDWQPLTLALAVILACYVSGHGDDLIYYLLYLPIVVLIHELGHVVAGRLFGCEIERLQVFFVPFITYRPREGEEWSWWRVITWRLGVLPLGGYTLFWSRDEWEIFAAESEDEELTRYLEEVDSASSPFISDKPAWQRLIISLGGVLFNFITFAALYAAYSLMPMWTWAGLEGDIALNVMLLSLLLGVLNLFPVYPLDGGAILYQIYEMVTGRKPSDEFTTWTFWIGGIIILLLFWVMPIIMPNFMSQFYDWIFNLFF